MLKPNKDGIAFTKEISRASRQTTEQPSTAGMSHKGNQSQSYTKKGNAKSKAPIGNNIHGLMDIDQYEFKSASASRLFSEGASDRQGEGRSVKVAKTRTPVPKPISMPSSASGKDMSKTVSLEDYHFTSLPGTEAPLIPLTAYHLNNVGVGLSATSDGRGTTLPAYQRGGTSFETMLLQTHTMAEAHKGHKMYSRRRPASGSALGLISGRRREIMEKKEKALAEFGK